MFKLLLAFFIILNSLTISNCISYEILDAKEGSNITLKCNIYNGKDFEYPKWESLDKGKIVGLGSSILNNNLDIVKEGRIFYSENKRNLNIVNLKYSDIGDYKCINYDHKNIYSYTVKVRIYNKIHKEKAYEGVDVKLICDIGNIMYPKWTMINHNISFQGSKYINSFLDGERRIDYADNKRDIIIKNIKLSDAKDYVCRYNDAVYKISLIVETPLKKNIYANWGTNVVLSCNLKYDGDDIYSNWVMNPFYKINFDTTKINIVSKMVTIPGYEMEYDKTKNTIVSNIYSYGQGRTYFGDNGKDLVIESVRTLDVGDYMCFYNDSISIIITLKVYGESGFLIGDNNDKEYEVSYKNIEAKLFSDVKLYCDVFGSNMFYHFYPEWVIPKNNITLINLDDLDFNPNILMVKENRVSYNRFTSEITIKNIKIEESGVYTCFDGYRTNSINVNVLE